MGARILHRLVLACPCGLATQAQLDETVDLAMEVRTLVEQTCQSPCSSRGEAGDEALGLDPAAAPVTAARR